jgi:hypothetical protein
MGRRGPLTTGWRAGRPGVRGGSTQPGRPVPDPDLTAGRHEGLRRSRPAAAHERSRTARAVANVPSTTWHLPIPGAGSPSTGCRRHYLPV